MKKNNSNLRIKGSYSTLGKINLCITFNDSEKHKNIPTELIVVGLDWFDYFSDLILKMLWL